MTETRVSGRYARAIIDTAIKENQLEQASADLKTVEEVISGSREFTNLIKSPVVPVWKKKDILKEVFQNKVSPLVFHFITLLADKHRESLIIDIIAEFRRQYNKITNKVEVEITTINQVESGLRDKILSKLAEITGKTILPDFGTDKDIKGGIVIRIEDWVYDASVRRRLELLREELIEGNALVS
jgi:F-type H+-transporting ATPase subunit delta